MGNIWNRRLRWGGAIFFLLAVTMVSPPVGASAAPQEVLRILADEMMDSLQREREAIRERPQRLFELVDETVTPRVDFARMSRWILGKHWRNADASQRERFIEAFRTLLVRFYTSALLDDPEQLDKLPTRSEDLIRFEPAQIDEKGENALVRGKAYLTNGAVVPVHFRMHRGDGGEWKIFDVNVEGVSLVTTYRSSFAEEIREAGLDGLIERLNERNRFLLNRVEQRRDVWTASVSAE